MYIKSAHRIANKCRVPDYHGHAQIIRGLCAVQQGPAAGPARIQTQLRNMWAAHTVCTCDILYTLYIYLIISSAQGPNYYLLGQDCTERCM